MEHQEQLYVEYRKKVYSYIYSRVNNSAVAEDICSEVFLKIMEKRASYDAQKASVSTWIYSITHNTLMDYFRARREMELNTDIADDSDVSDGICRRETLELLAKALKTLPERERDIILLHYYYKAPLKEIADRIGLSLSYTKALQSKALEKLQKIFKTAGLFVSKNV